MIELEVRCCCDAHLVGWVTLPGRPYPGKVVVFALERHQPLSMLEQFETLSFECAVLERPSGGSYIALKSRDYPIEKLRRIHGFVEATAMQTAAAR